MKISGIDSQDDLFGEGLRKYSGFAITLPLYAFIHKSFCDKYGSMIRRLTTKTLFDAILEAGVISKVSILDPVEFGIFVSDLDVANKKAVVIFGLPVRGGQVHEARQFSETLLTKLSSKHRSDIFIKNGSLHTIIDLTEGIAKVPTVDKQGNSCGSLFCLPKEIQVED